MKTNTIRLTKEKSITLTNDEIKLVRTLTRAGVKAHFELNESQARKIKDAVKSGKCQEVYCRVRVSHSEALMTPLVEKRGAVKKAQLAYDKASGDFKKFCAILGRDEHDSYAVRQFRKCF